MLLNEFDLLFEECVEFPLRKEGFHRYKKTKTLVMTRGDAQLSLIRLGGRRTRPGHVAQIICFRHIFLRPTQGDDLVVDDPVEFTLEPSDYPFKLLPRDFTRFTLMRPRYRPLNLGLGEYDLYRFEDKTSDRVRRDLTRLRDILVNEALPWSSQMRPWVVAEQIKRYGEKAWCEMRWLADYEAHMSSPLH